MTIALATLAADQISKLMVVRSLAPGLAVPVIPGLFDLTLVTNAGGIFGILRDADGPLRGVLFAAIPVVAILLMGWYAWHLRAAQAWPRAALGLIVGGAAGNLADRLRLGHVIDFLDAYVGTHHWPAFNLADSAICAGVALLLAEGIFTREAGDRAPVAGPQS
ncbi:MAG: signal peptidase II [Acidobacteria bacterium]|nr:signal peptidase II [Acidobacteriota bacterium]